MQAFVQDFRYSLRLLSKSPGFTVIAVITLALGIGANSTIFSWINATLLNPIPGVTHTRGLYSVTRGDRSEHPSPPFSYLDYRDLRDNNQSFSGLTGYHDDYVSITGVSKPERIYGALTSANYFDVLGARPELGRGFLPEEELDPGKSVVVISDALWRTHFSADSAVIGKTIQLNRHLYSIVGVAPPDFQGCGTGVRTDLWIPLGMDRFVWGGDRLSDRASFWLNAMGRLKPGVNVQQAEREMDLLMRRIVEHSPNEHQGPNQTSFDPLWRSPFGANVYLYRTIPMLLALAAVGIYDVVAYTTRQRTHEFGIRMALGAERGDVFRLVLAQGIRMTLLGVGVGLAGAWAVTRSLDALLLEVTANDPLTYAGVSLLLGGVAIAACYFPARRATNVNPSVALRCE